jgi:hypothetical protein
MKKFALMLLGLGCWIFGGSQIRNIQWVPDNAPRWNPFAIKESGIGRTLSRVLTEKANSAYHHGLFDLVEPRVANPWSRWLDAGNNTLGFWGRLKYRPIDRFPLKPFEVKAALDQAEKNLRFAFELDPGNYAAYDVYHFFLTTEITQTEFGTETGAPVANVDGDDDDDDQKGDKQQAGSGRDAGKHQEPAPLKLLGDWQGKERERRHQRAIEINEEAIRKFRPAMDPERYVAGAVMWYNRFMLMAPDVASRLASVDARKRFESLGIPTLQKMQFYLTEATKCESDLKAKALWETRPLARRNDYAKVFQFMSALTRSLSQALENNRAHMPGSYLGLLGDLDSRSQLTASNPNGGTR